MSIKHHIKHHTSKFKIKLRAIFGEPQVPTTIRLLVKKGIVKNERQALGVILAIIVLSTGISVFLIKESVVSRPAVISPTLISNNN